MLDVTLMLASTLPVATNWPSWLNAPERHACLCEVTYAVSYEAGSGAIVDPSVSYSRSMPPTISKLVWILASSSCNPLMAKCSSLSLGGQGGSARMMDESSTAKL